jgi:RNA polymerase sigma-54 factor
MQQKQRITPKVSTKLTPQLVEAMHILGLSSEELEKLLEAEAEQNPLLELGEINPAQKVLIDRFSNKELPLEEFLEYTQPNLTLEETSVQMTQEEREKKDYVESLITQPRSLYEYLMDQLRLCYESEEELRLGESLIASLDENGYLELSLEELAQAQNTKVETLAEILKVIQNFDPPGVGARNLSECLLIQLKIANRQDSLAAKIAKDYLMDLEHKHYDKIAHALAVSKEAVHAATEEIAHLDPKPGKTYLAEQPGYVNVDLAVQINEKGALEIELNESATPPLVLNSKYQSLLKEKKIGQKEKAYILEKIQRAVNLIRAIDQRKKTIREVTLAIFQAQKAFLERGPQAMKSLTLEAVAKKIGKHKSTVSRAVKDKYVQTPFGVYELKYFLDTALKQESGENISAENLKSKIAELIQSEKHPLSDLEIVQILKTQGLHLARRTVAKYREELKILPSYLRKKE